MVAWIGDRILRVAFRRFRCWLCGVVVGDSEEVNGRDVFFVGFFG